MELRDDDLLLRPIQLTDAEAIVTACGDEDIARFIPLIASPYTRADAEAWIERCLEVWRRGESYPFAITDAGSGELLGAIEVHARGGTVGYWVASGARNRGIATRALRLVCDLVPERPLRLTAHPDNAASQRVAEKAGFRRVGLAPHEPLFRDGTREVVLFELG